MKPDQERVRGLLTDTVTLLCKNGLQYSKELKVQGLLGITLDNDDVFVVHINEIFDGLVGGQVSGIQSGDSITSAIVAADSATQPIEREPSVGKSRKSTPHKHGIPRTSSPMLQGSSKRKASLKAPIMRIKKEDDDDDVVVMDSAKSEADNTTDFIPASTDLSGDGDREAMRMSYGGVEMENDAPPTKRRASDCKGSDSFSDQAETVSGAPFITGIVRNNTESDMLGNNSSLDGSQLSSVGQMGDGQVVFDNTPGCSAWDSSQLAEGNGDSAQDPGSQDSFTEKSVLIPWPPQSTATSSQLLSLHQTSPTMVLIPGRSWGKISGVAPTATASPNLVTPKKRKILFRRDSRCPDKPYRCQFPGCSKAFFRGPERNRHQKLKHGGIFLEPDVNYNSMSQVWDGVMSLPTDLRKKRPSCEEGLEKATEMTLST